MAIYSRHSTVAVVVGVVVVVVVVVAVSVCYLWAPDFAVVVVGDSAVCEGFYSTLRLL